MVELKRSPILHFMLAIIAEKEPGNSPIKSPAEGGNHELFNFDIHSYLFNVTEYIVRLAFM